jgi:hypothetical protein
MFFVVVSCAPGHWPGLDHRDGHRGLKDGHWFGIDNRGGHWLGLDTWTHSLGLDHRDRH